jgi:flavodoxin
MTVLIAYFSRADENYFACKMRYIEKGNTEVCAEKLQAMTGADLFKIEMKTPYAREYMTCIDQAKRDKNQGIRPELKQNLDSVDAYDTVILAYPNYWGTFPMAVLTFLESHDFSGKTILPLCTNEGSGMGNSESDLRKALPSAEIRKGLPVTGSSAASSDRQLRAWLKESGLL